MAELTEYALVILASGLFAGASFSVFGTYRQFESGLVFQSAFERVVGLALEAVETGTSSATVDLDSGTVSCTGGTLTMAWGNSSATKALPVECRFSYIYSRGQHSLAFASSRGNLTLGLD